jgi:hypothetical protein
MGVVTSGFFSSVQNPGLFSRSPLRLLRAFAPLR